MLGLDPVSLLEVGLDPVSLLEVGLLQHGARGVVNLLVEGGEGVSGDLLSALGGGSDALSMSAKGDEVRVVRVPS